MKREFSAGGIVFRKLKGKTYWLVAQHSQHKGWVFPKGLIGDHKDGEKNHETALREVEEETGVRAKIVAKLAKPATYFYMWKGEKRFKTVYYFLMKYVSGDINKHDMEMSAVEWWDEERVKKDLTYKSDKIAFTEALELFDNLPS